MLRPSSEIEVRNAERARNRKSVLYFNALRSVLRSFAGFLNSYGIFEPKLIAMVCTYCTYTAADMAGSLRLQYPHNVRIVKYLCTGKIDIQHILKAFEGGADAVLVGG